MRPMRAIYVFREFQFRLLSVLLNAEMHGGNFDGPRFLKSRSSLEYDFPAVKWKFKCRQKLFITLKLHLCPCNGERQH